MQWRFAAGFATAADRDPGQAGVSCECIDKIFYRGSRSLLIDALEYDVPSKFVDALGVPQKRRAAIRAGTEIQALAFHQRSSHEYMKTLTGSLKAAFDERDKRFGDYRTKPESE